MLADLAVLDEPGFLVGGRGSVEQEARWHRVGGRGVALDPATTEPSDELVEETPVAVAASTGGTATTLSTGQWQGADDFHFGSGGARIVEATDGTLSLVLEDSSVQNGPDLVIYVSPDPDGWTDEAVNLGGLKATDGTFSYEIPSETSIGDIASAVVWCRAFGVLFATATLDSVAASA